MSLDNTFASLEGTTQKSFSVDGPSGPKIKNESGVIGIRNSADNAYTKLKALSINENPSEEHIPNLRNLNDFLPNISFSFFGDTAPSPGDNTGEYGFCHTTGGVYIEGDVVYDTGSMLEKLSPLLCKRLTTSIVVSGDLSLVQYGLYRYVNSSWQLIGGGSGSLNNVVELLTYTDDTNKVLGPLASVPFSLNDCLFFWIPILQEVSFDYSIRPVSGGSAPGYYICISSTSTAPGGGTFAGGSNPSVGMDSFLNVSDKCNIFYNTP